VPTVTVPMIRALQFAGRHGGICYPAAARNTLAALKRCGWLDLKNTFALYVLTKEGIHLLRDVLPNVTVVPHPFNNPRPNESHARFIWALTRNQIRDRIDTAAKVEAEARKVARFKQTLPDTLSRAQKLDDEDQAIQAGLDRLSERRDEPEPQGIDVTTCDIQVILDTLSDHLGPTTLLGDSRDQHGRFVACRLTREGLDNASIFLGTLGVYLTIRNNDKDVFNKKQTPTDIHSLEDLCRQAKEALA